MTSISTTLGLEGQVAVLTGAAGGIGRATTRLLRAHGVRLVLVDRDPGVADLAAGQDDAAAVTLEGDVADEALAAHAVTTAVERFGRLDILVNNAGRTLNVPLVDTTAEQFDALYRVNALGAFLQTRAALRVMARAGSGAIVNVASIASLVAMPLLAAYASSKGAIAQLTKVAAVEAAGLGVRVNAVVPGVIETGILDDVVPDGRGALRDAGAASPMGRAGQPEEVAEAIAWLASPRASYVTGALLSVDGGHTAV